MNPLLQLQECGQSYWLDNLTRQMIRTGELHRRVTEQGLRGITSNPATFHKTIAGSGEYDDQIRHLTREARTVREICEELIITDVRNACDILRTVHEASDGIDGFVSLEVSPHLAHDTEGTMQEARRLFGLVDRANLFIKIPGTAAGVPAIEQMLYEGIPINITLLFSLPSYEAVAQAYLRALERRAADGKPVRSVASVASFFLSRIDLLVDQLLQHRIGPEDGAGKASLPSYLLGRVASANAKLAYQRFTRIFSGVHWEKLAAQGARVQRPLWASTGTKNPAYRDVRYVEPLIGPNTVNTMPEQTIQAFADHGQVIANSIEADLDESHRIFRELLNVGIDFDCVTWQLEHEGIQKFIEPYDALMKTLADKRQTYLSEDIAREARLHAL
jgi:transaldolase